MVPRASQLRGGELWHEPSASAVEVAPLAKFRDLCRMHSRLMADCPRARAWLRAYVAGTWRSVQAPCAFCVCVCLLCIRLGLAMCRESLHIARRPSPLSRAGRTVVGDRLPLCSDHDARGCEGRPVWGRAGEETSTAELEREIRARVGAERDVEAGPLAARPSMCGIQWGGLGGGLKEIVGRALSQDARRSPLA